MTLAADIASLQPGALVELFDLDMSIIGGDVFHFHAGTNQLGGSVVFGGVTYLPMPIAAAGFAKSGSGPFPRPVLTVSNVGGAITALILEHQDLIGCKVTRRRTLAQYLDAVNFPGGVNPTADPTQEYPRDIYTISRRASETQQAVQFELANPVDQPGLTLPARVVMKNTCTWTYKSAECGYVPGPMFDTNDASVVDPLQDFCGHRLSSCKSRFYGKAGTQKSVVLPYGGFPGAGTGQTG